MEPNVSFFNPSFSWPKFFLPSPVNSISLTSSLVLAFDETATKVSGHHIGSVKQFLGDVNIFFSPTGTHSQPQAFDQKQYHWQLKLLTKVRCIEFGLVRDRSWWFHVHLSPLKKEECCLEWLGFFSYVLSKSSQDPQSQRLSCRQQATLHSGKKCDSHCQEFEISSKFSYSPIFGVTGLSAGLPGLRATRWCPKLWANTHKVHRGKLVSLSLQQAPFHLLWSSMLINPLFSRNISE